MKYKKGFTLVELLVVISIIGILSTLAVVSLNSARGKARDAKRISDIKQIQTALEMYMSSKDGYPSSEMQGITLGIGQGSTLSEGAGFSNNTSGNVLMGTVPANPLPNGVDYKYTAYTSSDKTSTCQTSPCNWYEIVFSLEGATGNLSNGSHTASPNGLK